MEGTRSSLPLDKYNEWFDSKPYLKGFLGNDVSTVNLKTAF